ncbi:thioesterase II family protein [Micromonospora sp. NPDC000663]|uniref:thioesterase II family protein n=1 Tax=Micromonospora sp. NPDC000663 TaxID=3364218 RepID=UPI003693023A
MPEQNRARWFLRTADRPAARLTLYCLSHAGGAASAYRDWSARLPSWIDVAAVQLPGRERRIGEAPAVDVAAIAAAVRADADAVDRPYALFGHSMGGLLAFELAHRLQSGGGPVHLAISATGHPVVAPLTSAISHLPTADLLTWVREVGGAPDWLLADPQLVELLIPPLRTDCAWMETYVYRPRPTLSCPISVFAGEGDPRTGTEALLGWREETGAGWTLRRYPGGHFYLTEQAPHMLADLVQDLSAHVR